MFCSLLSSTIDILFLFCLIMLSASLWNVNIFTSNFFSLFKFFIKLLHASFVSDMHSISFSFMFFSFIKYFIFPIIVRLFPLPAPATTSVFISSLKTASFWFLSRDVPFILFNKSNSFELYSMKFLLCISIYLSNFLYIFIILLFNNLYIIFFFFM